MKIINTEWVPLLDRAAAGSDLYKRGEAFGIKGEIVDGMNVYSVIKAAEKAGEYVRSGKGPYILRSSNLSL